MKKKGVRLKTLAYVLLGASIFFGLLSIYGMNNVYARYWNMLDSSEDYSDARDSIDRLKEGSDYLTEQVRQYVITGDPIHMSNYFYEVDVRRSRDKAVESIINDMGIGESTVNALEAALEESNRLMNAEIHAMRIVAKVDDISDSDLPERVRDWQLTESELEADDVELMRIAGALVFGDDYTASKDDINNSLNRGLDSVEIGMKDKLHKSADGLERTLAYQFALTVLMLILDTGAVIVVFVMVIRPLTIYDRNIKNGEPLQASRCAEFNKMAETYNKILTQNIERRNRLKYKAEHDELTKLLNRTAFDKLCDSLTGEEIPFALMMVDVDRFKEINDAYGHAKGDEALLRVARKLSSTFRSDDYCVRYGGDEFVVLMTGMTSLSAGSIASKIEEINASLKKNDNTDLPSVSLSCGIAFSDNGYSAALFAEADKALYFTKEHGRSGYAFFDEREMHYVAA